MGMSAACMPAAWCIAAMKKRITITDFARMSGKARADKLSPERPRQIASEAGKKGGRPRQPKLDSGHRGVRRKSAAHCVPTAEIAFGGYHGDFLRTARSNH